jgi:hypothetical protein
MANGRAAILGGFQSATSDVGQTREQVTIIPYDPQILQAWAAS